LNFGLRDHQRANPSVAQPAAGRPTLGELGLPRIRQDFTQIPAHHGTAALHARPAPLVRLKSPEQEDEPKERDLLAQQLGIHTKLTVGTPGDSYEQEAERVAGEVMRTPRLGGGPAASSRNGSVSLAFGLEEERFTLGGIGPGRALDSDTREFFEYRFGSDFSQVRVHADSRAAKSAMSVNARAYTLGSHVVFGSGQYAPRTEHGRRLLAHELAHTLQRGNTDHVRRFVPCEQPSLSLQPCPPREKGEIAESRTTPMTVHGTTWLSEKGYSINGYLVVGFEVGKSAVKNNLKDVLQWKKLVALMKGWNIQWRIRGISDCSGSNDLNEGIRRARAQAIYNLLPPDARKNVVSTEALPLDDCITGNQGKVARTVNRSVMIEQVGRKVDIKPEEEETIEADLPKFVCGPDVTRHVADAVAFAKTIFAGWTHSQKVDACEALISYQGFLRSKQGGGQRTDIVAGCSWDIWDLHNNDWINKDFQPTCASTGAKPHCGESVQVDDDCHHAGAVNYVIFGVMFRLCADNVAGDFYFDFSRSNMRALVDIRKGSGKSGLATPAENFRGSLAWATAGYEGWPSVASPAGDRNNCAPKCPLPCSRPPFDIHWHPHRSRYTCP
jgi:hypothetical protein